MDTGWENYQKEIEEEKINRQILEKIKEIANSVGFDICVDRSEIVNGKPKLFYTSSYTT